MAKPKLKTYDEPMGTNLYVVGVVESVAKGKTVLVYADRYFLDDHSNLIFVNDVDGGEDFIFTVRAGDWKTVTQFEDTDDYSKCVRVMTLQERIDEITMRQLEKEEAEKKALEEEKAAEEAERTAAEKLKESIKDEEDD